MNSMMKSRPNQDCFHGGVYSVNPALVQSILAQRQSFRNFKGFVKKVCRELSSLCTIYPDPSCRELKNSILDYLGLELDPTWLLIGNGATELIHIFARAVHSQEGSNFCTYIL